MRIAIGLVLLAVAALPGLGQQGVATAQTTDLQWAGCWDLENGRADAEELETSDRRVCVESSDATLTVVTLVDGSAVRSDQLRTDGRQRAVEDGGCSGTERAVVSADGHRLYTNADLVCEGGTRRLASGISALLSPDTWIDIQVVRVGDERELMVRRFVHNESASQATWEPLGRGDLSLAARTARTAAAARVEIDDVIEAVSVVDAAAVEALLLESDASFAIDAGVLISLADAGVPGEVIDLMLALSFPDYFVVNEEPVAQYGPVAYGYPVGFYGYWSPAFAPFGWSYYYPWYPIGGPPIGHPPGARYGGRVVNGRGYARVEVNSNAPEGGFGSFLRKGGSSVVSGGRSGGKATPSGGTSSKGGVSRSGSGKKGSSGKTRTAKRRSG